MTEDYARELLESRLKALTRDLAWMDEEIAKFQNIAEIKIRDKARAKQQIEALQNRLDNWER